MGTLLLRPLLLAAIPDIGALYAAEELGGIEVRAPGEWVVDNHHGSIVGFGQGVAARIGKRSAVMAAAMSRG
uniref:Uncharacterized protein n=1 Tax=Setaria italica TaxID=4555 RepID=K4AHM2_SETIT